MSNSKIKDNSNLGFKGYTSVMKGIVISDEDPENRGRLRVRIPGYQGNVEDEEKLPWAQVCITKLPSTQSGGIVGFLQSLIGGGGSLDVASLSLSPSVGDVVWMIFEGGDINKPLIIGVLEYTARKSLEMAGTIGGSSSFSIEEGSPIYMFAQLIIKYESGGKWDTFVSPAQDAANGGSAKAITIGACGNMGPSAKKMMQKIRSVNQSEFDRIASPSGLLSDVTGGNNWNSYVVSESSAKGQAIKEILRSDFGQKGQILNLCEDIQTYIGEVQSDYQVTDTAATFYICDVRHQYGRAGAYKYVFTKGASYPDLESAYNVAKVKSAKYITRRTNMYNDLKNLRDSGKLNNKDMTNTSGGENSSNATNTNSLSLNSRSYKVVSRIQNTDPYIDTTTFKPKFMFPLLKTKNIVKYFEDEYRPISNRRIFHNGIDIYSPNIIGEKVYAVFNGTVVYKTDPNPQNGCGNQITLVYAENNNLIAEYKHLNSRIVKDGSTVKAGDVIGTVGNTGGVSTAMLHFGIQINGGYQNPLPYLKNYE